MTAIVLSRRAREDLKRIWAYIALDDDRAADRLLLALDARIARLRDFPGIGTSRDEIRPGARTLVHGRYLILCEHGADADRIEIVAVVEGMRDLDRLFLRRLRLMTAGGRDRHARPARKGARHCPRASRAVATPGCTRSPAPPG